MNNAGERNIAAHYLFDPFHGILKNKKITLDAFGVIKKISDFSVEREMAYTEFHAGLLCPYFINPLINDHLYYHEYISNEKKILVDTVPKITSQSLEVNLVWNYISNRMLTYDDSLVELLKIFTIQASSILMEKNLLGTFTKSARPGIILVEGLAWHELRITEKSNVKIIVPLSI